jgi:hypothetical protein
MEEASSPFGGSSGFFELMGFEEQLLAEQQAPLDEQSAE